MWQGVKVVVGRWTGWDRYRYGVVGADSGCGRYACFVGVDGWGTEIGLDKG